MTLPPLKRWAAKYLGAAGLCTVRVAAKNAPAARKQADALLAASGLEDATFIRLEEEERG